MDSHDQISTSEIIEKLVAGNDGNWPVDAATLLIVRHRKWLEKPSFREFIEKSEYGDSFGLAWVRLREALNSGLIAGDDDDVGVLQIATSIAMFYRVDLRTALVSHEPDTISNIAKAMMHAAGYTEAQIVL